MAAAYYGILSEEGMMKVLVVSFKTKVKLLS